MNLVKLKNPTKRTELHAPPKKAPGLKMLLISQKCTGYLWYYSSAKHFDIIRNVVLNILLNYIKQTTVDISLIFLNYGNLVDKISNKMTIKSFFS